MSPRAESVILHLSAGLFHTGSGLESKHPVIVNGELTSNTRKRYRCTHAGCEKAYTKPSRLEEHERSHTGQRPFVCETCQKSYLRDSHLQVHARTHLPQSARPFVCSEQDCMKRFMTSHHLRRHQSLHSAAKPFKCIENDCSAAFVKHHQLREHICSHHAPPGTKSYRCDYAGCTRSFSTNQHLRTHSKVHDDQRYTCVRPGCLPLSKNDAPVYFPTWSALQSHNRSVHPPTCLHPSCNGKTFSSQHRLSVHQKLHDARDAEAATGPDTDEINTSDGPRKKRRGGEYGRDWKCEMDGCDKDFKSKNALNTHVNVAHLGRRDHICPYELCGRAFGYKHLLQRHIAKIHRQDSAQDATTTAASGDSDEDGTDIQDHLPEGPSGVRLDIDTITGNAYAVRAQAQVHATKALRCPYPDLGMLSIAGHSESVGAGGGCEYVFSRAYDFRRHLKTAHGTEAEKEQVEEWVQNGRKEQRKGKN